MSALRTRIEIEAGQRLRPLQIFDITAARETTLSRLRDALYQHRTAVHVATGNLSGGLESVGY